MKPRKPKKTRVPKIAPVPEALIEAKFDHWIGCPPHMGGPFRWKQDNVWFWSKNMVFEFTKNDAHILRRDDDGKWWWRRNRGTWYPFRRADEGPLELETWMDAQLVSWLNLRILGGPNEGEEGRLPERDSPTDEGGTRGDGSRPEGVSGRSSQS